jgi:hypothetical protein
MSTAENTLCARYARGDFARLGRIDEIFAHWPAASGPRIRLDPGFDSVRADPATKNSARPLLRRGPSNKRWKNGARGGFKRIASASRE